MFNPRPIYQHVHTGLTQQEEHNPSRPYSGHLTTETSPNLLEEQSSNNQISPLLQFLEMADTSEGYKSLGSMQRPLSPSLDLGLSSIGLLPSDLLDQLSPPAADALGKSSSGTSPISMYFPDYSLDDMQRNIPETQATKDGVPVSQLIAFSEIAEMERTLDSCTGAEEYSTKEEMKTDPKGFDFGLEESLPELSPAESAANRLRRYERRRRQRARAPPEVSTNPCANWRDLHSNRFSTPGFVSVEPSHLSLSGTRQQQRYPRGTLRQESDLAVPKLIAPHGAKGLTPKRFISPIKGRRKNRDKMLELEQVNAMLRSKVDYLFAEMGQMRNLPASFPGSEAVTSQLTSYGRAQAQLASIEREYAPSGDTSHLAPPPELRRDGGRAFRKP